MEKWIEMLPWYPKYWISTHGRVYGRRGTMLRIRLDKDGHPETQIRDSEAKDKHIRISRVVCWYFNGPFPQDGYKYDAYHIDGNNQNNHYKNLEWRFSRMNGEGTGDRYETRRARRVQRYNFDPYAKFFPGNK